MLLLCSNGLTSASLRDCVTRRGGRTSALVVTADPDNKERNYHVPRVTSELESCGLTVDIVDLDARPVEALLAYDVVEFSGGNPYYLLRVCRRVGAKPVLKELAERKCLIGWSAGAIVMGASLGIIDVYTPEMNLWGLTDLTGLGLAPLELLPHYSRYLKRFERFEERCREYEAARHCHVTRLNDGEGLLVCGERVTLLR